MKGTFIRNGWVVCLLMCTLVGSAVWAEDEVQSVAQNMPGFSSQHVYQNLGNGETVNPDNGGLTVTHRSAIGLLGNMGSEVRPVRVYNSKLASDGFDDVNCQHLVDRPYGPLGFGWEISYGRVLMRHYRRDCSDPNSSAGYLYQDFFDYYYEDESGAQHHLFPLGGHTYSVSTHSPAPVWYVTNDGSYIRAKYQPSIAQWVLHFPDGSVRRAGDTAENGFVEPVLEYTPSTPQIPGQPVIRNPFSHGWYVTLIRDRAGNEAQIGYMPYDATGQAGTPLGGSIDRITDPFGRQIRFHYGVTDLVMDPNGVMVPVVDAAFLLARIGQFSSSQSSEADLLRAETFTYEQWTELSIGCAVHTAPVLTGATDPVGLQTRYGYSDTPYQFGDRVVLTQIYYPTGAVSSYEHDKYMYFKLRFWHLMPRFEESLDYAVMGLGVSRHTVESRVDPGSAAWNRLTWVWKRRIEARPYLYTLDSSYDFPVHPVITVDPLGTEEVRYFSADDSSTSTVPSGSEILTVRRRPGATPLDPVVIDALTDPRTQYNVWDQVISWTHKRYESGDFQGNTRLWGDSYRCKDVKWPLTDTTARFGNVRPYDIVQAEREVTGAEKWKKRSLSTEWNGFGEYRRTQVNDLSPQPSVETHFSGFRYDFPEDIPEFVPGTWTEAPHTYQGDRKTHTFSGAALAPGQGYQYRLVQYTRDADTGLVTGQRSCRNAQADPMHPVTSVSDKVLAITYTPQGNIASLTYSGGDSSATYGFAFTWQYGMVSQMSRDNSPYGAEFTREIDPDTSRIVSHEDANGLVTSFEYDALDRLTSIDPPGEEHGTYVSYPNDTSPAPGQTWTWVTSHDVLFYRGPAGFTPQVDDTVTDLDAGAAYQHYLFDDLGRLVKTRSLHPGRYLTETLTSYDPLGNAFFSSLPYPYSPGAPPTVQILSWSAKLAQAGDAFATPLVMNPQEANSPFGSVSTFFEGATWPTSPAPGGLATLIAATHELFDRPVWAFKPDGTKTKTTYSGLDTAATLFGIKSGETIDPNSESTTWYRKDILGRLRRVEPPLGTTAEYSYNGLDQLIQVDLSGQRRTFTYDALGRILTAQNPENGLTEYLGYDCIGNLLGARDANGRAGGYTLQNAYDPLGRLSTTTQVWGSGATRVLLANTYDLYQDEDRGLSLGKLVRSLSSQPTPDGTWRSAWQDLFYGGLNGRVSAASTGTDASGEAREFALSPLSYDLYGQLVGQVLPEAGGTVQNVYSHGALVKRFEVVAGRRSPLIPTLSYTESGALAGVTLRSGLSAEAQFDAFQRPAGFALRGPDVSLLWANGSFRGQGYAYDGAGNIASVASDGGTLDTFRYDELSRLVSASVDRGGVPNLYDYSYDNWGNLLTRTQRTASAQTTLLQEISSASRYTFAGSVPGPSEIEAYVKVVAFDAQVEMGADGAPTNRLASVQRGGTIDGVKTGLPAESLATSYDANGNVLGDGQFVYTYDALNRQTSVSRKGARQDDPATPVSWFCYDAAGERVSKLDFSADSPSRYTQYLRDGAAVVWEKSWEFSNAVPETQKSYFYAGGRMALTREAVAQAYSASSYLGMLIASHGGEETAAPSLGEPQFTYFSAGTHADLSYVISNLGGDVESFTVRVARVQPSAGHANANANGHASEQPVFEQTIEKPEYGWPSGSAYLVFPRLLTGWQYQVSLTIETTVGTVPALGPRTVTVEAGSLAVPTGPEAPHAWVLHRWVTDGQEEDGSPKVAEALAAGWRNVAPEGSGLYTLTVSEDGQSVPLTQAPVTGESALILDTSDLIRWCDPIAPPPQDLVVSELGGTGTTGVILPRPVPDLCVEPATGVAYTYTWASYGTDHLGTVRAVYTENPDGTTGLQTFDYEPFGVEIPGGNAGCGNTHRFTGQERDAETGNDYFHFRYFAAGMGRFQKPDNGADQHPESPYTLNLYAYCWNNPINRTDPDGRIAPLVAAWAAAEIALTLWDVAETTQTLTSPDSTTSEKVVTVVGLGVGIGTIGGGYSAGGKKALQVAKDPGKVKAAFSKAKSLVNDAVSKLSGKGKTATVAKGEIPSGSLAGKCKECAEANLKANPGSTLVSPEGTSVGHAAVQTPDGMVLDPSLRDNLATYGANISDIPEGKTSFTRQEWDDLTKRFPQANGGQ